MLEKNILKISALVFFVLVLSACGSGKKESGQWVCDNGQWIKQGNPQAPMPNASCGEIKENGIDENKKETMEDETQDNIRVSSPVPNEEIGLPLIIKGEARVFENTFSFRIKNNDGSVLLENYGTADSPDIGQFGPFEISVNYPKPKGKQGTVEVFEYSARDGEEINKVSIPVVFKQVESMTVKVFFENEKDSNPDVCSKVYPFTRRIPKTKAVARAAMDELLLGPTAEERKEGYFSSINQGVKIKSLGLENGVAKVDFDKTFTVGMGGTCRVEAVSGEINSTLKQFPTIKEVIIMAEGKEDVLKP
ncbi:MAG TPA: Gmad2 immunoglobulin-like domain-containing protein [Candidatus Moranbacteria bacterium]|nr:Gmad2 immunoglobulin-like domain-containing protein [Candidatus Moranbacteria bacterium]